MSRTMKRPRHLDPPAYLSKSPPLPKPDAAEPAPPPSGHKAQLEPTRYGDWEQKGIAWDF